MCLIAGIRAPTHTADLANRLGGHGTSEVTPVMNEKEQPMKRQRIFTIPTIATLLVGVCMNGNLSAANGPTDAQIVGIVLTANDIDIAYSKLALTKSKDKAVREYAQRMTADHAAVQTSVIALAARLGVKAEDSLTSESLKKAATETMGKLRSLKDKEFDRAYIDTEADYHKAVTDAVEGVLIPSASNQQLKMALQGAQPLFLKHLEHVRMIQAVQK